MKKNLSLIIALMLITQWVFAQNLKSYNGDFDSPLEQGQVKYSYYEDSKTGDKIKQGPFQYSYTEPGSFVGSSLQKKFTGNFKNGLKQGLWNYTITYTDYVLKTSGESNIYATGIIDLKMNYQDGNPTGNCSYSCNFKRRDIVYLNGQLKYGPYKDLKHTVINLNYNDGLIVGSLNVISYDNDLDFNKKRNEVYIKGQCDHEGNMDRNWKIVYVDDEIGGDGKVEIMAEYRAGFQIKTILRNVITGKVITTTDLDAQGRKTTEQLISGSLTTEKFKAMGFYLETVSIFNDFPVIFNSIFNNNDFLYSSIGGDAQLEMDKFNVVTYDPNGGFLHNPKRIE